MPTEPSLMPYSTPKEESDCWTTVAIVVATFGYSQDRDPSQLSPTAVHWESLANRAMRSTEGQGAKVLRIHGDTLAEARNEAAVAAESDYLIFLDADDELSPGYVINMLRAGEGDIRKPSTLGVVNGVEDDHKVMIPKRDLSRANHIVIGAMVNRDMFLRVGGFRELPALEDWDLFQRMTKQLGAEVVEVHDAIYRIHVSPDSRNQDKAEHNRAYMDIQRYMRENYGS